LEIINQELAKSTRHISPIDSTHSCHLYFPSNRICNDLAPFNIVPRKTSTYNLPILAGQEMAYFLRGYFYGDGCVYGNGSSRIYHMIASESFSQSLQTYLVSNRIVDRCNVYPIKGKSCYQIHFKGRQGAKLSHYIFFDNKMMLLPRKHVTTEEKVSSSIWSVSEINLLQSLSLSAFCETTGRSLEAAKRKLRRLKLAV